MKKENRDVFKAITMISQIGIHFMVPIAICCAGGYYLDQHFKTSCWFIILFFLGVMAAFRNTYHLTRSFYEKDLKREEEELRYWKQFKQDQNSSGRKEKKDTHKE